MEISDLKDSSDAFSLYNSSLIGELNSIKNSLSQIQQIVSLLQASSAYNSNATGQQKAAVAQLNGFVTSTLASMPTIE